AYNNIQFTGSGALQANASISLNANRDISVASGQTATFNNNGNTFTINGIVNGTGGNVESGGGGTTIFTGANTYDGTTTISAGTLQIGNGGSTGNLGAGSVTNNGTLAFNRASGFANNFVLANAIGGTGGFEQNGANIITISSSNAYTGTTTINSGVLRVTANEALGTAASGTTVNSGGQLRLSGVNYTTAEALSINGTGVSGLGALYNVGGNSTYAGAVTAATNATIGAVGSTLTLTGGLVKNGTTLTVNGNGSVIVNGTGISGAAANSDLVVDAATLVVNAASNYNGPTTVQNGGTFVANAQIDTTTLTVNAGSTASGTGSVVAASGGSVFLNGQFIVGDSTLGSPIQSQFTITTSGGGSTVVGGTGSVAFDLFTGAGSGMLNGSLSTDKLIVSGDLSLMAGAILDIANPNSMTSWTWGDSWDLWDVTGGSVTGTFASINAPNPGVGWVWAFDASSGVLSIVPEPSRALLMLLGTLGFALRRRRA
ncbi:MAG: autotransporter-associated beta strand repeat-containing protein, partial [Verrucomicrobiaceae bacterium]|nr:autotransporter-associated beta strand repeat-containing protein [Verrucomicrobiaceae bacterium]